MKQWKLDLENLLEFYLFTRVMQKGSKAQFTEGPKHTHRVGVNLSPGRRRGAGSYFLVCLSPLSIPMFPAYPRLCNALKNTIKPPRRQSHIGLGEAQFFCTLLTHSPGITGYIEEQECALQARTGTGEEPHGLTLHRKNSPGSSGGAVLAAGPLLPPALLPFLDFCFWLKISALKHELAII